MQLVLIPGLMCDHAVWQPLFPHLDCAEHNLFVAEHGTANSLAQMAELVLSSAAPRFAMAGHSMGGRVALEVMRLAPERVTHLALLDTGHTARASGEAGAAERAKRIALLNIARQQSVRAMAMEWVQGMVHSDRLHDAALIESIVAMMARKTSEVFAAQIEALLHRPDATSVLRDVKIPTLIACGRQDTWANVSQHEAMHSLLPTATLQVIEDSGHMCPMERPQAMAQALNHWLRQSFIRRQA
jgi:pimeloyl-ACP methyl ester carboxylesterase